MVLLQIYNRVQLPYARRQSRVLVPAIASSGKSKGFGSSTQEGGGKKQKKGKSRQGKISEKELQRRKQEQEKSELAKRGVSGVAAGYVGYGMNDLQITAPTDNERDGAVDEKDFEKRLASLKETGTLLAKEKRVEREQESSSDIYSNPPKIVDVLSSGSQNNQKNTQDKVNVGPSQFAIVGGSILLIAVFAITNGVGDIFVGQKRQTQQVVQELSQEERKTIQTNVDNLINNLKGDADDVVSLRSIAAAQIALGEYKKAESFLVKLSQVQQDDVETWSLLAQTRSALGDTKGKVAAYQNAVKADSQADIQLLQELTGALVSDGRAEEAVKLINDQISVGDPVYGSVELQLLLGKVYSSWAGHYGDALAVFDSLIKSSPEDFRGYLAKGVLLRNIQKKSDAERMFLQAKFFAPINKKSLVDQVVQQK
eukprot:TRINITY_DN20288_c1_g2_i1.p1 TRINITY_DN20288_c1_g2~~TRINITY_DN20288_c1_g2_i1.p1  ORF type:complete len:426 (-),score=79.47 TRINITY_DN20288_c1_g2_i1:597-1874(-)